MKTGRATAAADRPPGQARPRSPQPRVRNVSSPLFQKINLSANCTSRPGNDCVDLPKFGFARLVPTLFVGRYRFGVLRTLNASARNWIRDGVFGSWNVLNNERSVVL